MHGRERDAQPRAVERHHHVGRAEARGEELGVPGEREAGALCPGLRDRRGHDRGELAACRGGERSLEVADLRRAGRSSGAPATARAPTPSPRSDVGQRDPHRRGAARERLAIAKDDEALAPRGRCRCERGRDDLRTDTCRIAERDADARLHARRYHLRRRVLTDHGCAAAPLLAPLELAGCAGAEAHGLRRPPPPVPATPLAAADVGLHAGESMAFEVHIGGLLAGEAVLAVGEIGNVDGHRAIVVKSRAATAGAVDVLRHIVDEATTTIDVDSGRPLAVDSVVEEGGKHTTARATFGPTRVALTFARDGEAAHETALATTAASSVLDMHAAMGQLRGWKAAPGATRTVYVIGGRRLWRIDLRYIGDATVASAVGNRRAVQFDGQSFRARGNLTLESTTAARTFSVWLSDDADRVPLQVSAHTELGDITMNLTEYQRPS